MKKILLLSAGVALTVAYFGKKKVTEIKDVMDRLKLGVNGIRGIRLSSGGLNFKIDLNIHNPTNRDLVLNTAQIITLSKLSFYAKNGDFLGESFPNITGITIPANNSVNIPDLNTFVKVENFGNLINNVLGIFANPARLEVKAELSAMGQTYTI